MKIFQFWKPLLIAVLILYGSLSSSNTLNQVSIFHFQNMDKVFHFTLYFILSISFLSALHRKSVLSKQEQILINLIFVISYGLILEVCQYYFTSDRSAELLDALANTLGCIFGTLLFFRIRRFYFIKYL